MINQLGSRDGNYNMVRILASRHDGFSVCHVNTQSLKRKIDEFRYIFENSSVDAICVSETWFEREMNDRIVELNGYKIFRSDRVGYAGGVAIYIKNNISSKLLSTYNEADDVEYVLIEVNSHGEKLLLGCVYRSDKKIKLDSLTSKLELLTVAYPDIIIAGDFNGNLLTNIGTYLITSMSSFNLTSVNCSRPTHFTATSSTLLDLFFVSNSIKVLQYDQLATPAFSKHDLIFLSYNFNAKTQSQKYTFRDFNNVNTTLLEYDLDNAIWDQIYYIPNASDQLNFLNDLILQIYNKHVPLKTKTVKGKERPWFTAEIKMLIEHRDNLYLRWKRYKTPEMRNDYRLARREVVSKIKRDKSLYYNNKFSLAVDSRKTWKQIRDIGILGSPDRTNDIDVDALNEQFVNIRQPSAHLDFYTQNRSFATEATEAQFDFQCFNQTDILESFCHVKSNAVGLDDIHPRFIKIILPWIIPFLMHLFNTIITTSTFPVGWKLAKIIPVPKTDKEYRPIAVLPYLSKIFERLLHKQISKYVNDNNLLTDRQSGFRSKHSCLTALTDVVEEIRGNLDQNKVSFLVLLDHSKAFDTVEHQILSFKLKKMFKFSPSAVRLISSYLTNRTQSVYNNGNTSRPLSTSRGVPQGSILGPLLYTIYSNDLPLQIKHSKMQMYADDVQLYLSCTKSSINHKVIELNNDLNKILVWASANGLCLNPRKSKCLIIRKRTVKINDDINIYLGDSKIEIVETVKNLGVVFNKSLNWSDHINQTCGRIYGMLRSLWITQHFTPPKIRMLLAKTYLLPTLLYSSELFAGCNTYDTRKLNTTFNNIVRYVFGLSRFDHVSQYSHRILGISLNDYLKFKNLLFLHKIIYTKEPQYLFNRLIPTRSPRNNGFRQLKHRDTASKKQFFIYTINLWNHLPSNIQYISNAIKFKQILTQYFC